MGFLINQYQGFSGNAVEMASVATQCAQYLQMPGDLDKINERLVRYYVTEGLVDRPKRIGRDAEYGYLHLLQFLAGRFLVEAGFPMQKVAPYLASLEVAQLETLVMNKTKPNMAELLVASFASPRARAAKRTDEDWIILNQAASASSSASLGPSNSPSTTSSKRMRVAPQMPLASESISYDSFSMDLNEMAAPSMSADQSHRLDELGQKVNNLSDSIKSGMHDLLSQRMLSVEKERLAFEQQFERMRLEMLEERAQWRDAMEKERFERRDEFLRLQDKLNQLMAMMAELDKGKGKEND
jgi:DNA-binding transcriptional MerR regulator